MKLDGRIGIITPYKQQLHELRYHFQKQLGNDLGAIEINTVVSTNLALLLNINIPY